MSVKSMALIRDGEIKKVWAAGSDGRFHPDLDVGEFPPVHPDQDWRDITDLNPQPQSGWIEQDERFVDPETLRTPEEVQAKEQAQTLAELTATDGPFIRTLEDLIETLISKGVITQDDLPGLAADKLKARKDLRAKLNA